MFVDHEEVGMNPRSLGPHGKHIGLLTSGDAIQILLDAGPCLLDNNVLLEHLLLILTSQTVFSS